MIKVIQIIDSLNAGGAEVMAVNMANLLAKEDNIESHLCVTRKEGLLKDRVSKDVAYFFLKRRTTFDIKATLNLKKYIKDNKISIIHAHATSSFIAFWVRVFNPKIKVIWHNHYGDSISLQKSKIYLLRFFSRYFTIIISVNSTLKKWATKNLKAPQTIKLNNFACFNNKEKTTKLKGEKGKRIVCIAGFRTQKDHITLLKAFQLSKEENLKWSLHLVGKIYKDKYSQSIKNYIFENDLTESVFLYGAKLDIKNILSQATIGVLSSKTEGLPIALLEYGLAKLPVLVTNVGDNSKVISNIEALVEPNNAVVFSKKLTKLLQDDPLKKRIALSLHKKVKEEFSKENFIENLISIYKNLC